MTRALTLYQRHTQAELLQMQADIGADPANRNTGGGIRIYTAAASRKLADIASAITHHLSDKRAAVGNPVTADGYSGRQTNRRR